MKFSVFQVSRRGGRENNEDRMGYCYTRESGLFLLADGMGGHPQGEVAAQIAIQTVSAAFQRQARPTLKNMPDFLSAAMLQAHSAILQHARAQGLPDSPRTTLVAAVVQEGQACWAHCGDSRLYLVRSASLIARTRDHSYRELQQATGGQAVNRNVLFSCLGSPTKPVFDVSIPMALEQGDRLLLCSDGLWDMLDDAFIVQELARQEVAGAVPDLVEAALRKAGSRSDNVTAVAMQWDTPDVFAATQGVDLPPEEDGHFASTIQTELASGAEELDDATIERSIAEINETIQRKAALRKPRA